MKVLLLVDIQNDFCPNGSLAVPDGDQVVEVANALSRSGEFDLVIASADWHPADHLSFASNHDNANPYEQGDVGGITQTLWPTHCVQGTPGAEFHPALDLSPVDYVVRKGEQREIDSYSAFFDNGKQRETGLREILTEESLSRGLGGLKDISLSVCGLATDYCVAATARDAKELGIDTQIILDASRAVNLNPGDEIKTLRELKEFGIEAISSVELLRSEARAIRPERERNQEIQP